MMPLKQEIKEFNHLKTSKSDQSSVHEKNLEHHRSIYLEQEQELNNLQSEMVNLTEEQQNIRQNILIWTEKGRSATLTIDRGRIEHSNNNDKIKLLKKQIKQYDKEVETLQSSLDESLIAYQKEKQELESVEADYHKKLKDLDRVQNDRWLQQRAMVNDRSIFDRTSNLLDEREVNRDVLNLKISDQKNESKNFRSEIKILEKNQKLLDKNLSNEKSALAKSELELQNRLGKQHELVIQYNNLLVKKGSLKDRLIDFGNIEFNL